MIENVKIKGNRVQWDEDYIGRIPNIQEVQDSKNVKIDFSDVTLETSPEDINKKKEALLENYTTPTEEELQESYKTFSDKKEKCFIQSEIYTAYTCLMIPLMQSARRDDDFDKTLKYANQLVDQLIDHQQKLMRGENDSSESIFKIESPFRSRLDKLLGRSNDPLYPFKENLTNFDDKGKYTCDFIKGLKKVKSLLPQAKEERMREHLEREKLFATHFPEYEIAYQERSDAEKDIIGKISQITIKDNASQAFDEQLKSHTNLLEEEKLKKHIENKKNEIREKLAQRQQSKKDTPLSGTVVADIIAQDIIKDRIRHQEKVDAGVLSVNDKEIIRTPTEMNNLAKTIQKNIADRRNTR